MNHTSLPFYSIAETADWILEKYVSNTDRPYYQGGQNIYFDGWDGLGTSTLFAAVAESARRKKSMYDVVIHVDCSMWESRRALQRRIAEQLNLVGSAVALLFGRQDEDDDFSGIDKSSRAEIDDVAKLISQAVKDRSCLLIFNNGSDDEIDLSPLGVPVYDWRNTVLWTFRGRFRLDPSIKHSVVKSAHVFLTSEPGRTNFPLFTELIHSEAAQVSREISPALIAECWLYLSLLCYNNFNFISDDQDAHACNYWVCDGIIAGDDAWEIGDRLYQGMRLEYLPTKQNISNFFREYLDSHQVPKHSRWVSVMPKNSYEVENIQVIPLEATSYFLTFQRSDPPTVLPNHLFSRDNKLRVLRLSWCTFSFSSPPFTCCKNLKFILIDSCIDKDDDLTSKKYHEKQEKKWAFLASLWVLDIRDTNWDRILSSSMIGLMVELRELHLKSAGIRWQHDEMLLDMSCLINLRIFRVIDSSSYIKVAVNDSLQHMENLELLDLSGNKTLHVLPNLSGASKLKVLIFDGCTGLKVVEPNTLPMSLESFSFDGFGPALRWKHSLRMPDSKARPNEDTNKELPSVMSKISLEGCEHLKSVFLRGLPNLKELNLSETRIEALDLEAMQVQQLERLFLLGCEKLVRVTWRDARNPSLKLLCIDTRGKAAILMDGGGQRSHFYSQQEDTACSSAHIVATDARFVRGFYTNYGDDIVFARNVPDQNFHLHLSATVNDTPVIPRVKEKECSSRDGLIAVSPYLDVIDKSFNNDGEDGCSVPSCTYLLPRGCHTEIARGGTLEIKQYPFSGICSLISNTQSLHIHDHSSISVGNLGHVLIQQFENLRWCHVTRCPKMHTVFYIEEGPRATDSFMSLETLWVSHLLAACCIWSRERYFKAPTAFSKLRCIHLHSCPRLRHVLHWSFPTMASLETIHITYCGELRQIFPKEKYCNYIGKPATKIEFPSLRRIHLHDLPMLKDVCETGMSAPMLETIKLRGCWSLKRLPAIHIGRPRDKPPTVVDCEKDLWDKLEWDGGLEASRPLFSPRHSRYYKKNLPRGSLLR